METIKDIIAEMRKRFEPYAKSDSNDARYVAYLGYAEFADRIEKAVTNCNQLKMREALNQLLGLIDNKFLVFSNELEPSEVSHAQYQIDKAGEAYEEPRRNCDVGTAEEQYARFEAYCNNEVCNRKNCGCSCKMLYSNECALEWAQMPYESEVK